MNQYVTASRIHIVAIFTLVDFWTILSNSDIFSTYFEKYFVFVIRLRNNLDAGL